MGSYASQVVQDFFHQQYLKKSIVVFKACEQKQTNQFHGYDKVALRQMDSFHASEVVLK